MRACSLALALSLPGGCVSVVTPPSDPPDPVTVFVLHAGRHVGLVLPESPGWVEYGYGEWGWYALNHDAWYDVFDTVLWPTQGALGRRVMPLAPVPGPNVTPLRVAGALAEQTRARLAREFESMIATRVDNPLMGLEFVMHADGYWFPHNCYDAVAAWLVELGCEVSWVPIRLGLSFGPV